MRGERPAIARRLALIEAKVDLVIAMLRRLPGYIEREGEELMSEVEDKINALVTEVEEQTTVVGGVGVLVDGLKAELQALRDQLAAQGVSPEALSKLDNAIETIDSNTNRLQAAAASGTSAEDQEQHDIHALGT
jgi:cell division septum initiation protein DivIVA